MSFHDLHEFIHGNVAVAEEPFGDDADADPCAAGVGVVVLGWDRRTRDRCVGGDDVARDRVKVGAGIGGIVTSEKASMLGKLEAGSPEDLEKVEVRRGIRWVFWHSRALRAAGLPFADLPKTLLEDVVFGFVVAVEGAPADAGLVDNVLNADLRVGPAFLDEAEKCVADHVGDADEALDF